MTQEFKVNRGQLLFFNTHIYCELCRYMVFLLTAVILNEFNFLMYKLEKWLYTC